MSWFRNIFNTKPEKNIQDRNRNKAAVECLRSLRFGPQEIRKALVELNSIRVKDLARADGVSAMTIYNTIKGRRTNQKAMELIASRLALDIEDIFPEKHGGMKEPGPQACTPEAPNRQP